LARHLSDERLQAFLADVVLDTPEVPLGRLFRVTKGSQARGDQPVAPPQYLRPSRDRRSVRMIERSGWCSTKASRRTRWIAPFTVALVMSKRLARSTARRPVGVNRISDQRPVVVDRRRPVCRTRLAELFRCSAWGADLFVQADVRKARRTGKCESGGHWSTASQALRL
jgi:hypothetical protein